jgi:hypothetical protein
MDPAEFFTLYLKGPKEGLLRALRAFGNPGDLDRYTIESCGAEVILGTEVALIRIPLEAHEVAVRELIDELRRAALTANLALGDDVNSSKSADQLYANYIEERAKAGVRTAGPKVARGKSTGSSMAILILLAIAAVLGLAMWGMLKSGADNVASSFK